VTTTATVSEVFCVIFMCSLHDVHDMNALKSGLFGPFNFKVLK
jgi:hypothetical protein